MTEPPAPVVVLAGGTGGAKLARGLYDICGGRLVVVANTGDDIVIHGAHVSPDPDLCSYWLADRIDARGWGIEGDTFRQMDGLRDRGVDVWFNLGDCDLAICRKRLAALNAGASLTDTLRDLTDELGIQARVLPMSDDSVQTEVMSAGRVLGLQEFLIRQRGAAPIDQVHFRGADAAQPTPEVLAAIRGAEAIIIGPSNPILSIGPILAMPGMQEALRSAAAPVVAVSPVIGGQILKGPTAECLRWAGVSVDASGVASQYREVLDGLVSDEAQSATMLPHLATDTTLSTPAERRRVAEAVLNFSAGLR